MTQINHMTKMNELEEHGGFVPVKPVAKTITFKLDDGEELSATIHIRRLSIGDQERIHGGLKDDDSVSARVIAEAITLGENGKEKIPLEKAYQLHPNLALAMLHACREVNGGVPKNSRPPMN